jgi:hypothetical protein
MTVLRGWAVADEAQSDYDDDSFEQTEPLETVPVKDESDYDEEGAEQIEPLETVSVQGENNADDRLEVDESEGEVEEFEETETEEEQKAPLSDHFMDATPVSTASSRLVNDTDVFIVAEAEQTATREEVSFSDESDEKETLEKEKSEGEGEESEGIEIEEEEEEFEEETPSLDRFMDSTLVSAASSRLVKDEGADIETECDNEREKGGAIKTKNLEMQETEETVDAAEVKEPDSRESMFSKLWWTKVRTETEDVPQLEEVSFDESHVEISVSIVDDEKGYNAQDDTFRSVKSNVAEKIQDVELEFEKRGTVARDEIATMRPLEKQAETEEIPDVKVDSIAADRLEPGLQASLEEESTKVLLFDTEVDVESNEEEESLYTSSGYVCLSELAFVVALLLFLDADIVRISFITVGYY